VALALLALDSTERLLNVPSTDNSEGALDCILPTMLSAIDDFLLAKGDLLLSESADELHGLMLGELPCTSISIAVHSNWTLFRRHLAETEISRRMLSIKVSGSDFVELRCDCRPPAAQQDPPIPCGLTQGGMLADSKFPAPALSRAYFVLLPAAIDARCVVFLQGGSN